MPYIQKETIVSCIINGGFSALFFFIFFSGVEQVAFGAFNKFTLDFLPQGFFIGFFAILPASLITLKRLKCGNMPTVEGCTTFLPKSLVIRVIAGALSSCLIFGGSAAVVSSLLPAVTIGFFPALAIKIVFGILVTLFVTPLALRSVFFHWNAANQ